MNLSVTKPKKRCFSFDQLFPQSQQREMGLHKLSESEKEALHAHVEGLFIKFMESVKSSETAKKHRSGNTVYAGVGAMHWIKDITEETVYVTLEDGSLWQIDPLDDIAVSLWLPTTEIVVIESKEGSAGYNYLLINTEDGEKAHAKYMGQI